MSQLTANTSPLFVLPVSLDLSHSGIACSPVRGAYCFQRAWFLANISLLLVANRSIRYYLCNGTFLTEPEVQWHSLQCCGKFRANNVTRSNCFASPGLCHSFIAVLSQVYMPVNNSDVGRLDPVGTQMKATTS